MKDLQVRDNLNVQQSRINQAASLTVSRKHPKPSMSACILSQCGGVVYLVTVWWSPSREQGEFIWRMTLSCGAAACVGDEAGWGEGGNQCSFTEKLVDICSEGVQWPGTDH